MWGRSLWTTWVCVIIRGMLFGRRRKNLKGGEASHASPVLTRGERGRKEGCLRIVFLIVEGSRGSSTLSHAMDLPRSTDTIGGTRIEGHNST